MYKVSASTGIFYFKRRASSCRNETESIQFRLRTGAISISASASVLTGRVLKRSIRCHKVRREKLVGKAVLHQVVLDAKIIVFFCCQECFNARIDEIIDTRTNLGRCQRGSILGPAVHARLYPCKFGSNFIPKSAIMSGIRVVGTFVALDHVRRYIVRTKREEESTTKRVSERKRKSNRKRLHSRSCFTYWSKWRRRYQPTRS
jgi:hypothetical protein